MLISNLALAWFFGFLHQGGVLPAISMVVQDFRQHPPTFDQRTSNLCVAFLNTYMPPRAPLLLGLRDVRPSLFNGSIVTHSFHGSMTTPDIVASLLSKVSSVCIGDPTCPQSCARLYVVGSNFSVANFLKVADGNWPRSTRTLGNAAHFCGEEPNPPPSLHKNMVVMQM